MSAWIRRQNKTGARPFVPADDRDWPSVDKWFESLNFAGFPGTVSEKLDALLQIYGDIAKDNIGMTIKPHLYPHVVSEIAARNGDEVKALNYMLHQLNYIQYR